MKKLSKIVAEDRFKKGTTFWGCKLSDIIATKEKSSDNIWILYELNSRGFEALDLDHMWGSFVSDDGTLYICDTDGYEIEVDGKLIDPEEDGEYLGPEKLQKYIKQATPEIINKFITEYEIKKDETLNEIVAGMIKEKYQFTDIVKSDYLVDQIESVL